MQKERDIEGQKQGWLLTSTGIVTAKPIQSKSGRKLG